MAQADTVPRISSSRVECILEAGYELGEGAIYHAPTASYWHVNILDSCFYVHNITTPGKQELRRYALPSSVGTIVPCAGELAAIVALADGFYKVDLDTGGWVQIAVPTPSTCPAVPFRFNDGKCGPDGRFWAGTMGTPIVDGAGSLYVLDHDLSVHQRLSGIGVSNGLAWSPDGLTMFYIDTHTAKVVAYDYDGRRGMISRPRDIIVIANPDSFGWPDGCCMDAGGHLWIAFWGGNKVVQYDVATGEPLTVVPVPVKRVTSCTFGGPTLSDLYITTAWEHATSAERAAEPLAGSIFLVRDIGHTGLPANEFRPGKPLPPPVAFPPVAT